MCLRHKSAQKMLRNMGGVLCRNQKQLGVVKCLSAKSFDANRFQQKIFRHPGDRPMATLAQFSNTCRRPAFDVDTELGYLNLKKSKYAWKMHNRFFLKCETSEVCWIDADSSDTIMLDNYNETLAWEELLRLHMVEKTRDRAAMTSAGRWYPTWCIPRHRIALLVPYRQRSDHLSVFLNVMHPFLRRQLLDYTIFVIEQVSSVLATQISWILCTPRFVF